MAVNVAIKLLLDDQVRVVHWNGSTKEAAIEECVAILSRDGVEVGQVIEATVITYDMTRCPLSGSSLIRMSTGKIIRHIC